MLNLKEVNKLMINCNPHVETSVVFLPYNRVRLQWGTVYNIEFPLERSFKDRKLQKALHSAKLVMTISRRLNEVTTRYPELLNQVNGVN